MLVFTSDFLLLLVPHGISRGKKLRLWPEIRRRSILQHYYKLAHYSFASSKTTLKLYLVDMSTKKFTHALSLPNSDVFLLANHDFLPVSKKWGTVYLRCHWQCPSKHVSLTDQVVDAVILSLLHWPNCLVKQSTLHCRSKFLAEYICWVTSIFSCK
jgi:hypothetical protein